MGAAQGVDKARGPETGPFFKGRFGRVARDEAHCLNAVRRLAIKPVRARLRATLEVPGVVERARAIRRPIYYSWQSQLNLAHCHGNPDAMRGTTRGHASGVIGAGLTALSPRQPPGLR